MATSRTVQVERLLSVAEVAELLGTKRAVPPPPHRRAAH